jgi:hypothetical protein
VAQATWNSARDLSEWPDAPDGAEMCKQLGERGRPWPWRELLACVFEGTDLVRLHTQRHRSSGDPLVDSERVFHRRALITRRE